MLSPLGQKFQFTPSLDCRPVHNHVAINKNHLFSYQGCKIKMDESGNILIKRFCKSPIHVKNTIEENAVSNDILKLPNGGLLDLEKPFKVERK